MGVNSLPKTITRPDLNPGPTAPESSTQASRLRSHPRTWIWSRIRLQTRLKFDGVTAMSLVSSQGLF